jgi:hypothetical protein
MEDKRDKVFLRGYAIEELPNLVHVPYAYYRHKDGRVAYLPADPYSLHHYLAKGLVLVDKPNKSGERRET